MRRKGRRVPFVGGLGVLLTLALVGAPALELTAQQGQTPPRSQELTRQEMVTRLVKQFEHRLIQDVGIDRTQLEAVHEVMNSMRHERRELFQRRRALEQQMKRFAEEGGSEREARRLLAQARAIRADEARLESEEEARLLEILSPTQVLRYLAMRDDLNERIRALQRRPDGGGSHHDSARGPGRSGAT